MKNNTKLSLPALAVAIAIPTLATSMNTQAEPYSPVIGKTFIISAENRHGATLHFNMLLELMRSVASHKDGETTLDRKMVRFSVNDKRSGTGFHVANQPTVSYSQASARGGLHYIDNLARAYSISINPTGSTIPIKVKEYPKNHNKNFQHDERYETNIGISGQIGAEVSKKDGPKTSAEVGFSYSETRLTRLVYDTKEYETVNLSTGSKFHVNFINTWLKDGACGLLKSPAQSSTSCGFLSPPFSNIDVWDISGKITPAAYANFTPNFAVDYEVDPAETGSTRFDVRFSLIAGHLVGSTLQPFQQWSESETFSDSNVIHTSTLVDVDWSHPVFEPEMHVQLQSLTEVNSCLEVNVHNQVELVPCEAGNNAQLWGLTTQGQYRNRKTSPNQCLTITHGPTNPLAMSSCGTGNDQRWKWDGDYLVSDSFLNNYQYTLGIAGTTGVFIADRNGQKAFHAARLRPRAANISL